MKRVILSLLSILFSLTLIRAQAPRTGSLDEALAKAKTAGKPLLIDFFAETG